MGALPSRFEVCVLALDSSDDSSRQEVQHVEVGRSNPSPSSDNVSLLLR
jgi:hypothetical protein